MYKSLTIKLILIALYLLVSLLYFYDEHFPENTGTLYTYGAIPFMVVSMSFGVILSATLYNMALFIYLKSKEYLFYALAQLSALFFLINLDSIFIAPFDEIFGLKNFMLFDFSNLLMLTFSILFLKSFFENYNLLNVAKLVKIILYLVLIDFIVLLFFSHIIIFKFIPIFIPIVVILSEALEESKSKDLPFKLVIIAWSIVLVIVSIQYLGILTYFNIDFPFFHIAIALESVILSLAIAYKFKLLSQEREEQQILLLQQSRLASIGTLISSIAHQWRQPLNVISFGLMNIKKNIKHEKSLATIQHLKEQLQYMSSTIEDFRNFYNPSKVKDNFDVHTALQQALKVIKSSLDEAYIKIEIIKIESFNLFGAQNELEQVLLTLLSNAKDACLAREINEPRISIKIDNRTITILDNAGGIEKNHIEKIFTPYFSTKEESDGIGLHIAKLIVEQEFNGSLRVQSFDLKTMFTLSF